MNIHQDQVCLSKLKPALRRRAWDFITAHRPTLKAALEGNDPTLPLPELLKKFSADLWVPMTDTGLTAQDFRHGA